MKKLTKQEINDILLKNGRKIVLTGEYKNAVTQTSFTCDHGHSWLALWSNINSGYTETLPPNLLEYLIN